MELKKYETVVLEGQVSVITSNLNAEVSRAIEAETINSNNIALIRGDDTIIGSVLNAIKQSKNYTDAIVNGFKDAEFKTLSDLVDVINGGTSVNGSFRQAIAEVVGTAPESLNTLKEIADALENDPSILSVLRTYMESSIASAVAQLRDGVSEELDTFAEVSAKFTANMAVVTDAIAAAKAEAISASILAMNEQVVAAKNDSAIIGSITTNKIVFSKAPLNGQVAFGIIKVFDSVSSAVYREVQVTLDSSDASGRTFIVNGDTAGAHDNKVGLAYFTYKVA